jgi:hypothetical protein
MSNGALKELERYMNEELKAKGLNIKVEVKGMSDKVEAIEQNLLTEKVPTKEDALKINEAFSKAVENWKKKYHIG